MGSSISTVGTQQKKSSDNVKSSSATPESSGIKKTTTIQIQTEETYLAETVTSSKDNASTSQETLSPSCLINLVTANTLVIERKYKERPTDCYITMEFQEAVLSLSDQLETTIDYKPKSELSRIWETLTQNFKEHQTVVIFCTICADILDAASSSEYTGISTQHIELVSGLLYFLINCSDYNSVLSSIISDQTNFLLVAIKKLQQWKVPHFDDIKLKSEDEMDILEFLCWVLHNITMFEDTVAKVRDVNCIETMKPYLESKDNTIRLVCLATLADLVNVSESEIIKTNGDVINNLIWTISMAIESEDKKWEDQSLKELTRIVRQVSRNDNNKRTVVKHGAVPLLVKILDIGNKEEQHEAVRAILTLSFDKQNKTEMIDKKEWNVIESLKKISESSDEKVREISRKALWTITDKHITLQPLPGSKNIKETGSGDRHIMISYNWGHKDTVKEIRDSLMNIGHRVWMDVDDMHGSTLDAMAKAVEQAYIFLMCYSSKYKNSDSCRVEAEYAFKRKKEIIPLWK